MNNSICTLFDNILIDIHKFKSLHLKTTEGVIRTWSELTEQVRNALSYVSGYKKNMNGCLQNWLN